MMAIKHKPGFAMNSGSYFDRAVVILSGLASIRANPAHPQISIPTQMLDMQSKNRYV